MYRFVWLLLVPVLFAACRKNPEVKKEEIPVTKRLTWQVYAEQPYTEEIFRDLLVDLRLQIHRINYQTGEMELLFDSAFASRPIQDFPLADQKLIIAKSYPAFDSYQKINISWSARYSQRGTVSQVLRSDEAVPGRDSILLEARL